MDRQVPLTSEVHKYSRAHHFKRFISRALELAEPHIHVDFCDGLVTSFEYLQIIQWVDVGPREECDFLYLF